MNRQSAMGMSDDRINEEGSGKKEWLRRTKSNNSLNPTRVEHVSHRELGCRCGVCARVNSGVRRFVLSAR
jgi:hypothetical protein